MSDMNDNKLCKNVIYVQVCAAERRANRIEFD